MGLIKHFIEQFVARDEMFERQSVLQDATKSDRLVNITGKTNVSKVRKGN